jgi:peptide deformylase
MALLPIVTYGHPALRKRAEEVRDTENVGELIEHMFETMYNAQGIGLAANQVAVLKRVIVIDVSSMDQEDEERPADPAQQIAMINPEILAMEGEYEMEEGCLSIPAVRDVITRADRVRVRFRDAAYREQEIDADGILARVILHEIDHINGVLFIDHLVPGRRKLHKGALLDLKRGEFEVHYPIVKSPEEVS